MSRPRFGFSIFAKSISTFCPCCGCPGFGFFLPVIVSSSSLLPEKFSSRPSKCRFPFTGSRVISLIRLPVKRSKSSARCSLRSSPGDETSSVYAAPGTASSTSRIVETSRLTLAQSSCVTPSGLSMVILRVRALPPPRISTSTTSIPCAAATRPAISRIVFRSSAIPVLNRRPGRLARRGAVFQLLEPCQPKKPGSGLERSDKNEAQNKSGRSAHWYVRHELGITTHPSHLCLGRNQLQLHNNTLIPDKKQRAFRPAKRRASE